MQGEVSPKARHSGHVETEGPNCAVAWMNKEKGCKDPRKLACLEGEGWLPHEWQKCHPPRKARQPPGRKDWAILSCRQREGITAAPAVRVCLMRFAAQVPPSFTSASARAPAFAAFAGAFTGRWFALNKNAIMKATMNMTERANQMRQGYWIVRIA